MYYFDIADYKQEDVEIYNQIIFCEIETAEQKGKKKDK